MIERVTVLTCPHCGHAAEEAMPTDACRVVWICPQCRSTLRPLSGDCCVYCSYATVPCPPIQAGDGCD